MLGGLTYDNRDNPADATEGYFLDGLVEPFYEFNYGNAAVRMTAEGRTYYSFDEDNRIVAAGRLKIGSIVGAPVDEIAPDKLFFAGGGGSVRGYAYQNIGIVAPDGDVSGGRSLIEGSAELRVRVTDTIGVVAFADAGYVGADSIPGFLGGAQGGRRRRPALSHRARSDPARRRVSAGSLAGRPDRRLSTLE